MGYRKRYEDSYLDDEEEEFEGDERTDGEKLAELIQKPSRTPKQDEWVKKLTERVFVGAKLPGPPGETALAGTIMAANAYASIADRENATALWLRISELATALGKGELYYQAMDEITNMADEE